MTVDPLRRALVTSEAVSRTVSRSLGRALDVAVAAVTLVALAPLFTAISLAIWTGNDGPIFFRQRRIGRNGRDFSILKFRTMISDSESALAHHLRENECARREWESDHKVRNDPRVTPLGRALRASSLDELPQLINVLRGEMSIVGPRPIVRAEVVKYGSYFPAYCMVRPGMTGIWQVSGRNDVSYARRVEMDALYTRKKSVILDVQIIALTIPALLTRRGSY